MTTKLDEQRKPSYDDVRRARRAARKSDKAARKAAKPRGIDYPIWKAMPKPLLAVFLAMAVATLVLVVAVMVNPPAPRIAVAERRSAPGATVSHEVGPIVLAPIPSPLPATQVRCDAVAGVTIEGGPPAHVRIGGVLERMCQHANAGSRFGVAFAALKDARIRFARFARSGDTSTLSVADPPRILINIRFARRDTSAMQIAPLLAHEGYHLAHRDEPPTAGLEFEAREAELEACRLLIEVDAWPRGCTDARRLVEFGRERAVAMLVRAGFARG